MNENGQDFIGGSWDEDMDDKTVAMTPRAMEAARAASAANDTKSGSAGADGFFKSNAGRIIICVAVVVVVAVLLLM